MYPTHGGGHNYGATQDRWGRGGPMGDGRWQKERQRSRSPEQRAWGGGAHEGTTNRAAPCTQSTVLLKRPSSKDGPPLQDAHKIAQRQKQVDYGRNTLGYQRYLSEVPKYARDRTIPGRHPTTPDVTAGCSKRAFDGRIRAWRRALHLWDPPDTAAGDGTEAPVMFVPNKPAGDAYVAALQANADNPDVITHAQVAEEEKAEAPAGTNTDACQAKPPQKTRAPRVRDAPPKVDPFQGTSTVDLAEPEDWDEEEIGL